MVIRLRPRVYKTWYVVCGLFLFILQVYNGIIGSLKEIASYEGRIQQLDGWYVSFYSNLIDFYKDLMGSVWTFVYACVIMGIIGTICLVSLSAASGYLSTAGIPWRRFLVAQKGLWGGVTNVEKVGDYRERVSEESDTLGRHQTISNALLNRGDFEIPARGFFHSPEVAILNIHSVPF